MVLFDFPLIAIDGRVDLRTDQMIHVHHFVASSIRTSGLRATSRHESSGQFSITDLLAIADGYDVPG